jgi:hypothetical protein
LLCVYPSWRPSEGPWASWRKREELRSLTSGSIAQRMSRAQRLLSRMPAIVNTYRELIEAAMKALTDPRAVFAAVDQCGACDREGGPE